MYSKQLQIKGRNSCVYFAEVRNDPDPPPPRLVSGCRWAATLKITRSCPSKCNLHPIIHKRKLGQCRACSLRNSLHSSDSRLHLFRSWLLPASESDGFYAQPRIRTASEGKAAGGKQKIPFITSEEPRRFPGNFTVFIINRKYAQFSSGWNRHSSGHPQDKP